MVMRTRQSQRRRQVLSPERIVGAAVELLDEGGEAALTVRALTGRLSTGSGAIYHHVGSMRELVQAATHAVLSDALPALTDLTARESAATGSPEDAIRAVALGLYDAVEEHPWLATQLTAQITRNPWGPVTPRVFESIGRRLRELDVPRRDWFAATSTLVHYILGATAQNVQAPADTTGPPSSEEERAEFLAAASRAWLDLDPGEYPFILDIADQLRDHDDRAQFLTGVNLILTGITRTPGRPGTVAPSDPGEPEHI